MLVNIAFRHLTFL